MPDRREVTEMTLTQSSPEEQLQQVLNKYTRVRGGGAEDLNYHSTVDQIEIYASLVAAIERLAPAGTTYYDSAVAAIKHYGANNKAAIPVLVGICKALLTAYKSGYLHKIEDLIHADLFADFLDMGEYLLREGYKDAAAVIVGGVLEEHLRKLCLRHSIGITTTKGPKKADAMNADLAKQNVYNVLDQKNTTAWLDLRNRAAHAKYGEYTLDQVQLALQGIRDFIARFPA